MSIHNHKKHTPVIHPSAYIAASAVVIGNVTIAKDASVWPMSVIRGDVNSIHIDAQTNIQDGSILHVTHQGPYDPDGGPLMIGKGVTVGHGAILHACTIENYCLIGMGAIIMDHVLIEKYSMIAAGSIVPPNKHIRSGELWMGNPAKKIRDLGHKQKQSLVYSAEHYVKLKETYIENTQDN